MTIFVISILLLILIPSLNKAKNQAKTIVSQNRQKQIVQTANVYGLDNNDNLPETVATIGRGSGWNWHDPRILVADEAAHSGANRAMSEYLADYIPVADSIYCCSAPKKYKYLQDAWQAGNNWDNPESPFPQDRVIGTYCFYWNYTGLLAETKILFKGPQKTSGQPGANLIVSDYFGFRHDMKTYGAYGSCEKFNKADKAWPQELLAASTWIYYSKEDSPVPAVRLNAGYIDGHVAGYRSTDTERMEIIMDRSEMKAYPRGIGPGIFFIPRNSIK